MEDVSSVVVGRALLTVEVLWGAGVELGRLEVEVERRKVGKIS